MIELYKKVLVLLGTCSMIVPVMSQANAPVTKKPISIAIVEPLQHEAMDEIIGGYRDGMKKAGIDADIAVKNGQLDPNIEKSIFKELANDHTNIIAPIGTTLFEMAIATVPNKPIVGIATSIIPQQELNAEKPLRATALSDAINPTDQLQFMKNVIPNLKKIALVYSTDDNIISQVKNIEKIAKQDGIQVQGLMVSSAPDLYTISHHIDKDAGAILVLKDHMIVSGVAQLAQQAQGLQIPLITSDDGSVQGGGALAFGITERQIGEAAAKITAKFIKGTPMKDLPVSTLKAYRVFLNMPMAIKQGMTEQEINHLKQVAKQANYPVINCTATSC